ncbi:MAG: hypothetical protein N2689_18640, partial [Verrucomicrobiae bacterium]|nr:hypothetical protein [Verrucomicrobiae bacterium]
MRIGSDDAQSHNSRRIALGVGVAVVIGLAAAGAWYFLGADPAETELREAESSARQSLEAGDYGRAAE